MGLKVVVYKAMKKNKEACETLYAYADHLYEKACTDQLPGLILHEINSMFLKISAQNEYGDLDTAM